MLMYLKKNVKRIKDKFYRIRIGYLSKLSPTIATKILYKKKFGKRLNLENPVDFNEKVLWLKLYWQNPMIVQCADKYLVREYVKSKGAKELLNDLYGIYKKPKDIPWETLPEKFVIKTTNGAGTNLIIHDKTKVNRIEANRLLAKWLKRDYSLMYAEPHYSKMQPHINCEKLIETKNGELPIDYKIFCFNGVPKFVMVVTDRILSKGVNVYNRHFFDLNWNKLQYEKNADGKVVKEPEPPKHLNDMIYYAKKLSKDFPFVRIDFYDSEERPILGEFTFTPAAGMAEYFKKEVLIQLGSWIQLPEKYMVTKDSLEKIHNMYPN